MKKFDWRMICVYTGMLLLCSALLLPSNRLREESASAAVQPLQSLPASSIAWGTPVNTSNVNTVDGANEPAAAMHPTDPLLALSGGNTNSGTQKATQVDNTVNGGNNWSNTPWQCPGSGIEGADGVPAWLANGSSALFAFLCNNTRLEMHLARSTSTGGTWAIVPGGRIDDGNCGPQPDSPCNHDREYLWTDFVSTGSYHGRTYLTEVEYSADASSSLPWKGQNPAVQPNGQCVPEPTFLAAGLRYTTDQGDTWSNFASPGGGSELKNRQYRNEFPALAIEPNDCVEIAPASQLELVPLLCSTLDGEVTVAFTNCDHVAGKLGGNSSSYEPTYNVRCVCPAAGNEALGSEPGSKPAPEPGAEPMLAVMLLIIRAPLAP